VGDLCLLHNPSTTSVGKIHGSINSLISFSHCLLDTKAHWHLPTHHKCLTDWHKC